MKLFLTGTDTGVGKTRATTLLTAALRRSGIPAVAVKPFCSGDRSDIDLLREASDHVLTEEETTPVWLATPAAPSVAARLEGKSLSLAPLVTWFAKLAQTQSSILLEGAGGWLVPVSDSETLADLAVQLGLPVVVVVANRLGCINHTLLTLESIRSRGLHCPGIILNTIGEDGNTATRTNAAEISRHTRVLLEISPGQRDISASAVEAFVAAVNSTTDHPAPQQGGGGTGRNSS
jgi:dethiobiotin synthetase